MKKSLLSLALAVAAFAPVATCSGRAEACGGCFISQSESTQVTGHRMAMSISQDQTTLYDQIQYSGSPESFAWILPIRGEVEVGLSSDALFAALESMTQVSIYAEYDCGSCGTGGTGAGDGAGPGPTGSTGSGVEVIAAAVVGPYETVQISSTDPNALLDWLELKGYSVPPEIEPVIDDYVTEGFDFLALRLVPGAGIDAMRPVRITTPGASPTLPLRMVAAGTGAKTVMSLWVLGEGRYEPQNFPSFEIAESELVWNFDAQKSNYADLREQGFTDSNGFAWLTAAAEPQSSTQFQYLVELADASPTASGYADEQGMGAVEAAEADVETLLAGIPPNNLWVTRLDAELSRPALAEDLILEASIPQNTLTPFYFVSSFAGDPGCPDCGGGEGGTGGYGGGYGGDGVGAGYWTPHGGQGGEGDLADTSGGGCSSSSTSPTEFAALAAGVFALAGLRRRRAR